MKCIAILIAFLATNVSASAPSSWIHVKGGAWDPDEAVLLHLGASIQSYVTSEATRLGSKLPVWDQYRFQYQGRLDDKRKRIVLVNAFCHSSADDKLESEFLFVDDGGPCFFTLEYDQETREFRSLRFNGYA
jgi:hypothetical protein